MSTYRPDGGSLSLDGTPCNFKSPHEAAKAGVAIIYQELDLIPQLTVAENLFFGLVVALKNALMRRQPDPGLYFHSDQGSQYSSAAVQRFA